MSRHNKRHAKRAIIVDGVEYTWKYGNTVEIRRGRAVVLRVPITDVLGVTWDMLERADRNGYGYPLTPAKIERLIRDVTAGAPRVEIARP